MSGTPKLAGGSPPPLVVYDADIIILTISRVYETIAAVRSACRQTTFGGYGLGIHVIVLDQGSPESEFQVLAAALLTAGDVSLYRSSTNLGVAGGRNFLAQQGHGKIIVGLDNDAVFGGDHIVAQTIRRFADQPRLGAIGFQIRNGDGTCLDDSSWGYPQSLKPRRQTWFLTTTFVGAGHAIRRSAWQQAGGYDAKLFFTWEEYDFCRRAIKAGWQIGYDGSLAVWHKAANAERVGWQGARLGYFVRNRLVIARKWREPQLLLIAGYVLKGLLAGRFIATLAGIRAGLRWKLTSTHAMPPSMLAYLQQHEVNHRGSWWQRVQSELFRKRPAASG
ncbi:MAG: glycosyltransferase family 2 protein [Acidocella sp.]|nr:glycosyltransferase family 2 protein [Acidocella sp.]